MYAVILYVLSFKQPATAVYTPSVRPSPTALSAEAMANRLNLNTATAEELMQLPGIGKATAAAIISMREKLGAFRYPEDLLLVHGIGEKKLDAIYDLIYVK